MTFDRRALAIKTAKLRSKSNVPTSEVGFCLREVRECLAVDSKAYYAAQAYQQAQHKHSVHETRDVAEFLKSIPRGCPVFWSGGTLTLINGHWVRPGHVALATGFRSRCFSTDILRDGYFDKVALTLIHEKWGLSLLGWTEDLNGVKVYP